MTGQRISPRVRGQAAYGGATVLLNGRPAGTCRHEPARRHGRHDDPDDACAPELDGFERDGAVLTPSFREVTAGCDEPLIPKTFVVALDRASVAPSFTLRLPRDETYGHDEQCLDVDLAVAASGPGPATITLYHRGVNALRYQGRDWEVPDAEQPFDATNAPPSFVGGGTVERVSPYELRYTDASGLTLRFVPDDGTEPPCA